jgi:hypothetical protein
MLITKKIDVLFLSHKSRSSALWSREVEGSKIVWNFDILPQN